LIVFGDAGASLFRCNILRTRMFSTHILRSNPLQQEASDSAAGEVFDVVSCEKTECFFHVFIGRNLMHKCCKRRVSCYAIAKISNLTCAGVCRGIGWSRRQTSGGHPGRKGPGGQANASARASIAQYRTHFWRFVHVLLWDVCTWWCKTL